MQYEMLHMRGELPPIETKAPDLSFTAACAFDLTYQARADLLREPSARQDQ